MDMALTEKLDTRIFAAAFSGHRELPTQNIDMIKQLIRDEAVRLIVQEKYLYFASGGARGFDLLAAQVILELKEVYPHIGLYMVLPCADQSTGYSQQELSLYNSLLHSADHVRYTSFASYFSGCMWRRNKYMVDHSSVIIAYQTHRRSGTSQTTDYARKCGLQVINLAERG